jgi:hypothetical protein
MKARVHDSPGERGWDAIADPTIIDPTDAIVRIVRRKRAKLSVRGRILDGTHVAADHGRGSQAPPVLVCVTSS